MATPATLPISSSSDALSAALAASTESWQNRMKSLFERAKDRFPDVIWDTGDGSDGIWGHKAIIYARVPPSLQERYLSPGTTTHPGAPHGAHSLAPSTGDNIVLRIPLSIDPDLLSNELEFFYTGGGPGAAFDYLFDTLTEIGGVNSPDPELTVEVQRRDKLRQDLVSMWRSRLGSDVRISLTGSFSSRNSEVATAVFSSHRFILVSRVPYFRNLLPTTFGTVGDTISQTNPLSLKLPAPPFTPASLYFTLGFIYTGTMSFSKRNWDLDTIFNIFRGAKFLGLNTLENEARARIIKEMMHGLFHAYLPFNEYERIIEGKWGTGGCKCKQCQRRAPRVLEFALGDAVGDSVLERGAQRALTSMYGKGWATSEFLALPLRLKNTLLNCVKYRTLPHNIIPLLLATQAGLEALSSNSGPLAEEVKKLIHQERNRVDEVLCNNLCNFWEQPEWVSLLEIRVAGSQEIEMVDSILQSIRRGLTDKNVAHVYHNLVSLVLPRKAPTPGAVILRNNPPLRAEIENLRVDIIRWMQIHWTAVKMSPGFKSLERWVMEEISNELNLLTEPASSRVSHAGTSQMDHLISLEPNRDAESASVCSVVTGVAKRISGVDGTHPPPESLDASSRIQRTCPASRHSEAASFVPPTREIHPNTSPTKPRPAEALAVRAPCVPGPDSAAITHIVTTLDLGSSTLRAPVARQSPVPKTSPHPSARRTKLFSLLIGKIRMAVSSSRRRR